MAPIQITKQQARMFLLRYQGLYDEFEFAGMEGILSYVRRVGCIQFDPLNVVGTNPELDLQSRIKDFNRNMLWELLYKERKLVDYWDKNMSIFPLEDWHYFQRQRDRHQAWCNDHKEVVERVYTDIQNKGYLCSGDLDDNEKVNWSWGPTRLSRATLEGMYHAGLLIIHHKVNTRKYYDLAVKHIPEELYFASDPFETNEEYYDWYVLRRIGSVGFLWNRPSDAWLGIIGMKSAERNGAFARLLKADKIIEVKIEGLQHPVYIRRTDLDTFNKAIALDSSNERASILAPLDNLLWDRRLIKELFDFDYRWEVYKPVEERQYGYYVLPVLYGDKLVARFEPSKHRGNEPLTIKNWWWEDVATITTPMKESILKSLARFSAVIGASYREEDCLIAMNVKR